MKSLVSLLLIFCFLNQSHALPKFNQVQTKCSDYIASQSVENREKIDSGVRFAKLVVLTVGAWVVSVKVASHLGQEHLELSMFLASALTFVIAITVAPRSAFVGDQISAKNRQAGFGPPERDFGVSHSGIERQFIKDWKSLNRFFDMNSQIGKAQVHELYVMMRGYFVDYSNHINRGDEEAALKVIAYMLKMMNRMFPQINPDYHLVVDFAQSATLNSIECQSEVITERIMNYLHEIDPEIQQPAIKAYYQSALDAWAIGFPRQLKIPCKK